VTCCTWLNSYDNANTGYWRISVSLPNSEDLGEVYFSGSGGTALTLLISTTSNLTNPASELVAGCNDWAGLLPSGKLITFQASLTGNLIGSITADKIV
jgi:hypothetical protein